MISTHYERERTALLDVAAEADAETPVPACPGWTVADVIRHLVGLCDDWLTGRLEIYASAEWTSDQVSRFEGLGIADLRGEWDERARQFGAVLDDPSAHAHLPDEIRTVIGAFPTATFPSGILVDLAQHSADVTSALGVAAVLAPETVTGCNRSMSFSLRLAWPTLGQPSIALRTTDSGEEYRFGDGEPELGVDVSSFDLFRTFGGRRTTEQITQLSWHGESPAVADVAHALVVPFFAAPTDATERLG